MPKNKCLNMIQTSQNRWQLVAPKGNILVSDIMVSSELEAKDYVKRYISSFMNWEYKLEPIKKELK